MNVSDTDYWRSGIADAVADDIEIEAVVIADTLAGTGEEFWAALSAAEKLQSIHSGLIQSLINQDQQNQVSNAKSQ